jgi:uncharacterized protein YyaL (SSP411 family)
MGTPEHGPHLQNVLANSTSPYLRAHKDNPVAWQEWSEEAIALAKKHQRLIFLSIGYNACHWCHVMEKESFMASEVAKILNNSFIPIKLDRESRPDLDDIYMNFVTATTGSGGWPLNVFLTPDLHPVFGGTYWPGPSPITNIKQATSHDESAVTFIDILRKMEDVWSNQREKCIRSSSDIVRQLQEFAAEGTHSHSSMQTSRETSPNSDPPEPLDLDLLDDTLDHFISRYDSVNGGFSTSATSPKFPTPANLKFLLRIGAAIAQPSTYTRFGFPNPIPGIIGKESCMKAAAMSLHTLLAMSRSGLRDQLGYGFHRYSVTADWNLPHFEKMTCDNAQLLACYCDAWALGRDPEILGTIYNLVEYFTNPNSPIVRQEGGWYASEDADSHATANTTEDDKKEGAYYVWTLKEFQSILGDQESAILARHFGVSSGGNVPAQHDLNDEFLSQNVLHIAATPSVLAKEFGLAEEEIVRIIKTGRAKLSEHRNTKRGKPTVDTKIITSWNALAIDALARASATLRAIDKTRALRCQEAAERAAHFIRKEMFNEATSQLVRIHQSKTSTNTDKSQEPAFIDDYAYLTRSLIALYDLTFSPIYLDWSTKLQTRLDTYFLARPSSGNSSSTNSSGAGYYQSEPTSHQILRLKPGTDNSQPSPNGIIAANLLYLSSYLSQSAAEPQLRLAQQYVAQARSTIDAFAVEIIQHPFLYVSLLAAVVIEQIGVKTIIVPRGMRSREVRRLKGFGRTVVRGDVGSVMICTREGVCRELRMGELEDGDADLEDEGQTVGGMAGSV